MATVAPTKTEYKDGKVKHRVFQREFSDGMKVRVVIEGFERDTIQGKQFFNCAGLHVRGRGSFQTKFYRYPAQLKESVNKILEATLDEALENRWIGVVAKNESVVAPWHVTNEKEGDKFKQIWWIPRVGTSIKKPKNMLVMHPWQDMDTQNKVSEANKLALAEMGRK